MCVKQKMGSAPSPELYIYSICLFLIQVTVLFVRYSQNKIIKMQGQFGSRCMGQFRTPKMVR